MIYKYKLKEFIIYQLAFNRAGKQNKNASKSKQFLPKPFKDCTILTKIIK